jgi:hypothetical protein
MYVRYVTNLRDEESPHRLGVIWSARQLQDRIAGDDFARIENLFAWFKANLKVPNRFTGLKRRQKKKKAICCFKDSSYRCIFKVKLIVAILEDNGITTARFVTRKPGYIVYEDSHQVAAIPYRDTFDGISV